MLSGMMQIVLLIFYTECFFDIRYDLSEACCNFALSINRIVYIIGDFYQLV